MKNKSYLTGKDLRSVGFSQDPDSLHTLLNLANRRIAERINAEIPIEIKHNYDKNLLEEYSGLIEKNGFLSDTTQYWLKEHIAAIGEITTDHINIMLADLRMIRESRKV